LHQQYGHICGSHHGGASIYGIPQIGIKSTMAGHFVSQHISHKAQFVHRAWHLEGETSKVPMIKELVSKAKELGCIEAFWGQHMHVTELATYDTTATELKRLAATVNWHTNYQYSMTIELLKGIIDVDYAISYHAPEGRGT
jgi:hypothetical protein